jgi:Fic family protein
MSENKSFIVKHHWMDEHDVTSLKEFYVSLDLPSSPLIIHKNHPMIPSFRTTKAITAIYTSNKLESTLPNHTSEDNAYKILNELYNNEVNDEIASTSWSADGNNCGNISPARAQLYNHLCAYKYLCETVSEDNKKLYEKPLTVEVILTTHRLLLNNAFDENQKPVKCGVFRNHAVHAADYDYLNHNEVSSAVDTAILNYNNGLLNHKCPIQLSADLFYELITAHPFVDGNGRLCRLFAAYSFFATGTPFAVSITSGHSKARNHYITSILKARRISNDRRFLYTLFLNSLQLGWSNFTQFTLSVLIKKEN